MARKRNVVVDIKANTGNISAKINEVNKKMSSLIAVSRTMNTGINQGFKSTTSAIQSVTKVLTKMNTALATTNTQMTSMTKVMSKVSTQLTSMNNNLKDSKKQLIDIGSNTSATNTKLDHLNRTMGRIETLLTSMNVAMKATSTATTTLATSSKTASTAVTTMGATATTTASAASHLAAATTATSTSMGLVTPSVNTATAAFKQFQSNLGQTFSFMKRGKSAFGDLMEVFNPRRFVEAAGYSLAYGIVDAPMKALRAVGAGIKQQIDDTASLEGELFDIEAYMGGADGQALTDFAAKMGEVGDAAALKTSAMGMLQTKIMQVGQTTSFTSLQIAKAVTEAAKAGITIDELGIKGSGALDAISLLSQNTGEALEKSAQIVGNLQNNFEFNLGKLQEGFGRAADPAEQYVMVVNALAEADSSSAATASQLTEALYNVGGSANNINMSFFETTALISSMVPAFESAASAGTSLKYVLSRITGGGSTKAAQAMKEIGLMDQSGQSVFFGKSEKTGKVEFKGLRFMMEQLREKFGEESGIAVDVKNKIITDIFGQDALKAVSRMIAMTDVQANELYDMADKMTESARLQQQTAQSVADIKNEGLEFDLEYLSGSLDSIKTTLAMPLMKPMSNVVQTMSGLANGMFAVMTNIGDTGALNKELKDIKTELIDKSLVPGAEGLFKAALKYAEGLKVVLGMIGKEGFNLKTISTAIAALFGTAVPDLQSKAAQYAVTLQKMYYAISDFIKNLPTLLSKVSTMLELLFSKLSFGIQWLIDNWDMVKTALANVLTLMAVERVVSFTNSFIALGASFSSVISEAGGLHGVLQNLMQIVGPKSALGQGLANTLGKASVMMQAASGAAVYPVPAAITPPFINTWSSVGSAMKASGAGMWASIVAGAKAAAVVVGKFFANFSSWGAAFMALKNFGTALFMGLKVGITALLSPLGLIVAAIIAFVALFYYNVNGLRDFIYERFGGIFDYISSSWESISKSIMSRWEIVSAFFSEGGAGYGMFNGISNMFKGIMVIIEGALVFVGGLFKTVLGLILFDMDLAGEGVSDMWVGVVGVIGGAVKTVLGYIQSMAISAAKWINWAWGLVSDTPAIDEAEWNAAFEGWGNSEWMNVGAKTADNLNKGIQKGLLKGTKETAKAAKKFVTTGLIDPITGELIIQSPSGWGINVGYYIGQGISLGITSSTSLVRNAMDGLAWEVKQTHFESPSVKIPTTKTTESSETGNVRPPLVPRYLPYTIDGQEKSGVIVGRSAIDIPWNVSTPIPGRKRTATVTEMGGRGNQDGLAGSATVSRYGSARSALDKFNDIADVMAFSSQFQSVFGSFSSKESIGLRKYVAGQGWESSNLRPMGPSAPSEKENNAFLNSAAARMGYANFEAYKSSSDYQNAVRTRQAASVVGARTPEEYARITAGSYQAMVDDSRGKTSTGQVFLGFTDYSALRNIAKNTRISADAAGQAEKLIKTQPKLAAYYAKKMGVSDPSKFRAGLDLDKVPEGYALDFASRFNMIQIAPGVGLRGKDGKEIGDYAYKANPVDSLGNLITKSEKATEQIIVKASDLLTTYAEVVARGQQVSSGQAIEGGRGATSDVERYTAGATKQIYDSSVAASKNIATIHYDKLPISWSNWAREMEGYGGAAPGTFNIPGTDGKTATKTFYSNTPLGFDLRGTGSYGYGKVVTEQVYRDLTTQEIAQNAPKTAYMPVAQLPTSDMRGDFSLLNLEEYSSPEFDVSKTVKQFDFATGEKALKQRGLDTVFADIPALAEQYGKIGDRAATFLRMKNGVLTKEDQVTFNDLLAKDKADRKAYMNAAVVLKGQLDAVDKDTTLTDAQKKEKKSKLTQEFTDKNAAMGRTYQEVYGIDVPSVADYAAGKVAVPDQYKQYADLGPQKINEAISVALNPANQSEAFKKLTPEQQAALTKQVRELPSQAMAFYADAMADGVFSETEFEDYMMYAGEDANLAAKILARGTGPTDEELDAVFAPYIDGLATTAPTEWFTGPLGTSMVSAAAIMAKAMGQDAWAAFLQGWTTDKDGKAVNIGGELMQTILSYDPATLKEKGIPTGTYFADGIVDGIRQQLVTPEGTWTKTFDANGDLVSAIWEASGINSPSTVMRDNVGKWLGMGIVKGMFGPQVKAELKRAMSLFFNMSPTVPTPSPDSPSFGEGEDAPSKPAATGFFAMGKKAGTDFITGFFNEDTPEESLFTKLTTKLVAVFNPDISNVGIIPVYERAQELGNKMASEVVYGFAYVIDGKKEKEATISYTLANQLALTAGSRAENGWRVHAVRLGENIALGMSEGMNNPTAIAAIEKAAQDMICKAVTAARTASDCHSPSKLFADQVGQPISAGVAQGITDHSKLIDKAVTSAVGNPRAVKYQPDVSGVALAGKRRAIIQQVTNNNSYNLGVTTNQSPQTVQKSFEVMRAFEGL